jgi:LysM repeat protein
MNALRNRPTKRTLRLTLAAGFLLLGPVAAAAQEAVQTPKTHTVKKGDTLWDLAALYLGDAFRWPELYRLNTDVVEDPHWIYPGEILKLPGYVGTDLPGIARPGTDTAGVVPPTVVPIDTGRRDLTPTTFGRGNRGQQTTLPGDTLPATAVSDTARPAPTIRFGDFVRAPWIDRLKGPAVWGRILGAADLPGIEAARIRGRFQLNDRVLIAPPTGAVAPERELYLAYREGPMIEEVGQVIVPTGVVEVVRPPVNGEAAIARVVRMFREVNERDRLMPYDSSVASITGTPVPIKNGAEGSIRWVADDPVLPSPTYYMVLSLTSNDVKPGDHVELFHPRQKAQEEGQYATPEIMVGRAQIIRSTPQGSTAMITRLDQPKVDAKTTKVRVVARLQ